MDNDDLCHGHADFGGGHGAHTEEEPTPGQEGVSRQEQLPRSRSLMSLTVFLT